MEKSTHTKEYAALRSELRRAREAAGISQRELAERLAVPHSWVAKVESGERRVDLIEFGWFLAACGAHSTAAASRILKQISAGKAQRGTKANNK
jgi:transcriptional regulator with XRE-family HTH domain